MSDEEVRTSFPTDEPLVLPGGKVDPDAIRRAYERADDDDDLRRVTFTLQRDLKSRLDRYLTSRITFMSRTQLQGLIEGGGVLVNGREPKASTKLRLGDVVEVIVPPPVSKDLVGEEIPLDVLDEDDVLIVLNKQTDIIVHPARSELSGTMINALAWHFQHRSCGSLSTVGDEFARPGVVHRLDRNTSGCIVFAKTDEAHWKLSRQFERRTVDKRYLALVEGHLKPDGDLMDDPIGPHPSKEKGYREKQVVRHDHLGKAAITFYRVVERYRAHGLPAGRQRYTLVELELRTGRTHQIRVHLSHRGFPIVADDMYGGRVFETIDGSVRLDQQALHAAYLAFDHPVSGERRAYRAPLRDAFGAVVSYLRAEAEVERCETPGRIAEI
ncbi:MAG: RluA family pseudouridine synthase [Phycisphaerales bacterium]|nr:RluA family pseudouridine synthase [Phycisphaerales bacterium]